MKESQAVDALSSLSHELRLRIVRHLVVKGKHGDTAGAIASATQATPSKITFHISKLEQAGLVSSEKVSRTIIYRIEFEQIGLLINYLVKDCCKNDPEVMSCCGVGCK